MLAELMKGLEGEYLIIHTKMVTTIYPRGYCVYVDEEYIVLQEQPAPRQLQIEMPGEKKVFSKPFYVVPIREIRGIAGLDPQQLEEAQGAAPVESKTLKSVPDESFEEVDFDDQLPASYIEEHLTGK